MSFSDFKYILKNYYLTIRENLRFKLKPRWNRIIRSGLTIKLKYWFFILPLILVIWHTISDISFLIQKTINIYNFLASWWFFILISFIVVVLVVTILIILFLKKH